MMNFGDALMGYKWRVFVPRGLGRIQRTNQLIKVVRIMRVLLYYNG